MTEKAQCFMDRTRVLPQALMLHKVYHNPLWVLKDYSKHSSIKPGGFALFSFTQLKAFKPMRYQKVYLLWKT